MKRKVILVLLLTFNILLFGQEEEQKVYNTKQLQGIWQMYANYTYPTQESFYKIFHVFKGEKWLTVDLSEDLYDRFSVVVTKYGFTDSYFRDEICALPSLKDTGSVFVSLAEKAALKDCIINIDATFTLKEKSNLIIFRDECEYIDKLPKEAINFLYKRGKHDNRDYVKELLDMQVYGIQVEKSFIYDSTLTKTEIYLVEDDIIIVTGKQDEFIKMEYETAKGDTIKGWLKKEDVSCIQCN